jgi:very-short-patch-repair endonuclease
MTLPFPRSGRGGPPAEERVVERASHRMARRTSTRMLNRAGTLRKYMTEPEVMLWSRLKGRKQDRPIFRRQFIYEQMIFDFYCVAARLAVEIDGSTHWDDEKRARDEARDIWLGARGIEVLRIGAGSVFRDLNGVADAVIVAAVARTEALKRRG